MWYDRYLVSCSSADCGTVSTILKWRVMSDFEGFAQPSMIHFLLFRISATYHRRRIVINRP